MKDDELAEVFAAKVLKRSHKISEEQKKIMDYSMSNVTTYNYYNNYELVIRKNRAASTLQAKIARIDDDNECSAIQFTTEIALHRSI